MTVLLELDPYASTLRFSSPSQPEETSVHVNAPTCILERSLAAVSLQRRS